MKRPAIAKDKVHAVRRWIFRWKGLDGTPFPGLMAVLIVGSAFAFFAATVRIHVSAPQQWAERKASIIHLASESDGQMWALRAREGGPFPSRIEPSIWENSMGAADALLGATRLSSAAYKPTLRDLPEEDEIPPLAVSPKDERVFPKRVVKVEPVAEIPAAHLAPVLYPLSGISLDALPAELPAFEPPVDAAMASAPWRFLVRLQADGAVALALPLSDDPGGKLLADWLAGVNFGPAVAKKSEYIGIGVGFTNQAIHGPDAR